MNDFSQLVFSFRFIWFRSIGRTTGIQNDTQHASERKETTNELAGGRRKKREANSKSDEFLFKWNADWNCLLNLFRFLNSLRVVTGKRELINMSLEPSACEGKGNTVSFLFIPHGNLRPNNKNTNTFLRKKFSICRLTVNEMHYSILLVVLL